MIVATPKREGARREINPFLALRVEVHVRLFGSRPHGRLLKLRVLTNSLTGAYPPAGRSVPSLVVPGHGTFALLNDETVQAAIDADVNIDMRDN